MILNGFAVWKIEDRSTSQGEVEKLQVTPSNGAQEVHAR